MLYRVPFTISGELLLSAADEADALAQAQNMSNSAKLDWAQQNLTVTILEPKAPRNQQGELNTLAENLQKEVPINTLLTVISAILQNDTQKKK